MALKQAGIRLSLQGEAEYIRGLRSISQELRTMSTQSKLAIAKLSGNAKQSEVFQKTASGLSNELVKSQEKTKALHNAQKNYKESLLPLKKEISETTAKYSESLNKQKELQSQYDNSAKTQKKWTQTVQQLKDEMAQADDESVKGLQAKYDKAVKKQKEWQQTTKENKKALSESKNETKLYASELKELTTTHDKNVQRLERLNQEIPKSELATHKLRKELEQLDQTYKSLGGRYIDRVQKYQSIGDSLIAKGGKTLTVGAQLTNAYTRPILTTYKNAVVAAGEFHTEIGQLGPLLSNGAEITAEYREQMDQLGASSRQWAKDYGKSTTEINNGMAELIRNGYTSQQVMGMLPNMLDASLASGESFNTVMTTSSQVLSQFNLQGNNTQETLKNTKRVADSITYIANATASGFSDLGAGLAYVGPVANSLNMTIEETASVLGILSNKGIEASAGGTALRGAFTRLLKPSKQNAQAMAELGFSAEEFQRGTLKLPEIIDRIKENTKDWTDEQRAAAIATAFGTEAQTAMNALVEEGGDALRELTKEAEGASGATKSIAESMKELPEFKYQRLQAQVKDLGIQLGSQLLPIVVASMEKISDLATWFGNLDEGVQKVIIGGGLLVAALGPLTTAFGTLQTATGLAYKGLAKVFQYLGQNDSLLGDLTVTTDGATKSVTLLTRAKGLLGKAVGALASPLGISAMLVAGLGLAYYKLTEDTRKAHRAQKEFPDISKITHEQAESIRGLQNDFHNLNVEMGNLGTTTNVSSVSESLATIGDEVQRLNENKIAKLREEFEQLPESVQASLANALERTIQNIEDQTSRVSEVAERMKHITEKTLENGGVIPERYLQEVQGLTQEMMWHYAMSLSETATQAEEIYGTLTRSHKQMSQQQLLDRRDYLKEAIRLEKEAYAENKESLYDWAKQSKVTREELNKALEQLDVSHASQVLAIQSDMVRTGKEMWERYGKDVGMTYEQMIDSLVEHTGLSRDAVEAIWNSKPIEMSDFELGALETLNKVQAIFNDLDLKAGEINTESLDAFKKKAIESGLTWEELELLSKEGSLDVELKNFLNKLAEANGGWETLKFNEKKAAITTVGEDKLKELVELFGGDWSALDDTQKTALAEAKGIKELSDLLVEYQLWQKESSIEAKQATIETDAAMAQFKGLFENLDLWNNTEFLGKIADIDTNADDAREKIAAVVSEYTGLPVEEIKKMLLEVNDSDALAKLEHIQGMTASIGATDMPPIKVKAETQGVEETKSQVAELSNTADGASKTVSLTSSLLGFVANIVTIGTYKSLSDNLNDKTVTATSNVGNMADNSKKIDEYNKKSGEMKNTSVTAKTSVPTGQRDAQLIKTYNEMSGKMRNTSSVASTSTPNIAANTSAGNAWIAMLNRSYSKTSVLTTVHETIYRTSGGGGSRRYFAEGGHIGAFAKGGNISWGGAFARGGNVPRGYAGIVGEAGPEIFQVTPKGVSITPLSTREKMRGVEGVLNDLNDNNGQGVTINITIDTPVVREEQDIDTLAQKISRVLERDVKLNEIFKRGKLA